MVTPARDTYPELRFPIGSMTSLDLPDATLGGILALYSTVRTGQEGRPSQSLRAGTASRQRVMSRVT